MTLRAPRLKSRSFVLISSFLLLVPFILSWSGAIRYAVAAPTDESSAGPTQNSPVFTRQEEAQYMRQLSRSLGGSRRLLQQQSESNDAASVSSVNDPTTAYTSSQPSPWSASDTSSGVADVDMTQFFGSKALPWIPLADPYVISDNVPWFDMTNLKYTKRDWARWDSFDSSVDLFYTPSNFTSNVENEGSRLWGVGNGGKAVPINVIDPTTGNTVPLTSETYRTFFQLKHTTDTYTTGYSWFRYFAYGSYDIYDRLVSQNVWSVADVMMNVSYALNENYNIYRASTMATLKTNIVNSLTASNINPSTVDVDSRVAAAFDAMPVNFTALPRNNWTINWLEKYLNTFLDIQILNHTIIARGDPFGPYDGFGLFANVNSFGVGINQFSHFFLSPTLGFLYGYYLKLLNTKLIRRIRTAIYASLTAQYNLYIVEGPVENHSTCQWLLHITGWSTHAYIILRSEAILRDRGVWTAADAITSSNWTNGMWTNADLQSWPEIQLQKFVNRTQLYGFMEFNSPYYSMNMEIVSFSMLLAPTQNIYNLYEKVWKAHLLDLSYHLFPLSATFSGPSSRSYDLFDGAHTGQDAYDLPQYLSHVWQPMCQASQQVVLWNGTSITNLYDACTAMATSLNKASADENVPMSRIIYSTKQAIGQGYLPFDALINATLASPYRTVRQIFSALKGQERFNFLAPTYQIGWAGEDYVAIPTAVNVCARLAGAPVAGSYTPQVVNGATNSVSYVRIFTENNDTPFWRAWSLDVAGNNLQLHSRFLFTQYQSFMVTTSLLSGRHFFTLNDQQAPWNTNLVLPINVDALYADDYALPMTVNASVAINPNSVFIIRHQNASIAVRVLYFEKYANIPDATSNFNIGKPDLYQPGVGLQEYSMVWQTDPFSVQAGSGRITIHHKHRSTTDITMRNYRVVMLWAGGITRNNAEMWALQRTVRHATFTQSFRYYNGWNTTNQPWFGPIWGRDIYAINPAGDCDWRVAVNVGGVDLRVERHDQFQPWGGDVGYSVPANGPMNVPPYLLKQFNRTANGQDIFKGLFDDNNNLLNGQAFNFLQHAPADVVQAHLTNPIACVPGVDRPCYQWNPGSWSACSATCGAGTQVRSVQCADMSNFNTQTSDLTQCSLAPSVATTQTCNLGACGSTGVPSAPTITQVTAASQSATVTFVASTAGSAATSFTVTATPGGLTASASTSPISISGLKNGQSYTFTVTANNAAGSSALSVASSSVTPDAYTWVYSAWGTCSDVCNSGTQTRTVVCTGSIVGAVSGQFCSTPMPTDLSQACNIQACTWQTGTFGGCSAACSTGTQTRTVTCTTGLTPATTVADTKCTATKPSIIQNCNTQSCTWLTGQFSTCTAACGGGTQTRSVTCSDGLGNTLTNNTVCTSTVGAMPVTVQTCGTSPCVSYQWRLGSWTNCTSTCGGGTQTRAVDCITASGTIAADSNCAGTKPVTTQSCGTAACVWFTGSYGSCSKPCNSGVQTRTVKCQDPSGLSVSSSQCTATAPVSTTSCNTQSCVYQTGGFGGCSVSCGGGTQTQAVHCVDGTTAAAVVDVSYCASLTSPPTIQVCSLNACPAVPGVPTLSSVTVGNSQLTVTFSPPASNGGSAITSYRVLKNPGGTVTSGTGSPIVVSAVNGVAVTVQISAGNSIGFSNYSAPSQSLTPYSIPSTPLISSVVVGSQQVTVTFVSNDVSGGPAPSFEVSASPNGQLATGTSSPLTIVGLTNGVAYTISLVAINPSGRSVAATAAGTYTPATIPASPTITSVSAGNQQASVSFNAPASDGGSPILNYTVIATPGSIKVTGTASPILVTGLANTQSYTFVVYASNRMGAGYLSPSSASVTPQAPIGISTPPLNVIAVTNGNGAAKVSFDQPLNNGGAAISSYTVTATPYQSSTGVSITSAGGVIQQVFGATSPISISSLVNGIAYTFTVAASNVAGLSVASAASSPLTIIGISPAPTIGTATVGSGTATVSFSAPITDGGSPIQYYTATTLPGNIATNGATSPITIPGLSNGVTYTITVTATNAIGTSASSAASNPVKPTGTPGSPKINRVTTSSGTAYVAFNAPTDNGGSAITSYTAVSTPGGVTASTTTASGPVTVPGLVNGISYTFTMTAVNSAGSSSPSDPSPPMTPADVPNAPVITEVDAGDTQATIYFSYPNANGLPITSYSITSNPEAKTAVGTSSPLVVSNLRNGQAYTFTILAINAVGISPNSAASVSVTPVAAAPPPPPRPGTPIMGSATVTNGQVSVSFSANTSSTVTVISYTVTSSPGGITTLGLASPIQVKGLSTGVSYTFTVQANSANTVSSPSAASNAVAIPIPHWVQGGFGQCSVPCDIGTQTQNVTCVDATGATVADSMCTDVKPATSAICNTNVCVNWQPSAWGNCSVNCGGGTQTRTLMCVDKSGQPRSNTYCASLTPLPVSQPCNTQVCAVSISPPTVLYSDSSSITLGWTTSGSSVQYLIQMSSDGTTFSNVFQGPGPSATITGLSRSTTYYFQIKLMQSNAVWSQPVIQGTTLLALPSAPQQLSMQPLSDTSISVDWIEPSDDGGSPILSYTLSYTEQPSFVVSASLPPPLNSQKPGDPLGDVQLTPVYVTTLTHPVILKGLKPKTTYSFSVRARTAIGLGALMPDPSSSPSLRNTFSSPPIIVTAIASDSTGLNGAYAPGIVMTLTFNVPTNGPNLTAQAPESTVIFSTNMGTIQGLWLDSVTLAIAVSAAPSSGILPTIGSLTVSVNPFANLQSSDGLSLPSTSANVLVTGSFGNFHGLSIIQFTQVNVTQDAGFAPLTSLSFTIPPSTLFSILNSNTPLTLTMQIVSPASASFAAVTPTTTFSSYGTLSTLQSQATAQQVFFPATYSGAFAVTIRLKADAIVYDSEAYLAYITPKNHAPTFSPPTTPLVITINQWNSINSLSPIADFDANQYPSALFQVTVIAPPNGMLKFSQATNLVSDAQAINVPAITRVITGPLVWINQALQNLQLYATFSPLANPASSAITITVNDMNNGQEVPANPLQVSANIPLTLTCSTGPAPTMLTATYQPALTSILVGLDTSISRTFANATNTIFACNEYFTDDTIAAFGKYPSVVSCSFSDMQTILVTLSDGSATSLIPGQTSVKLKAGALRSCPSATNTSPAQSVVVSPPATSLLTASLVWQSEPCLGSSVTLKASASGGGFGLTTYTWAFPSSMSNALTNKNAASVTIDSSYFVRGQNYTFSVYATSWIGTISSWTSVTYTRPLLDSPIQLSSSNAGSLVRDVDSSYGLFYLGVDSQITSCISGQPASLMQRFSWSVTPTYYQFPFAVTNASSLAVNSKSLDIGQNYTFTVTTWFATDPSIQSSLSFAVSVTLPLKSIIVGPTTVSSIDPFYLDGSFSTGAFGYTGGSLTYLWTCAMIASTSTSTLTTTSACLDVKGAPVNLLATPVLGPLLLPAGRVTFTLTVSASGVQSDSSSQTVTIVASKTVYMSISGPTTVNCHSALQLTASVVSTSVPISSTLAVYTWSLSSGPSLTLPATAGTTLSLNTGLVYGFFAEGQTYVFQVSLRQVNTDGTVLVGTTTKSVYINRGPIPGLFNVSPNDGSSIALKTKHFMYGIGFTDVEGNVPLTYQFFYVKYNTATGANSNVYINLASTANLITNVLLPAGSPLTVGLQVTDSKGAYRVVTHDIVVQAQKSTAAYIASAYVETVATQANTGNNTAVVYVSGLTAQAAAQAVATPSVQAMDTNTSDASTDDSSSSDLLALRANLISNLMNYQSNTPSVILLNAISSLLQFPTPMDSDFMNQVLSLSRNVLSSTLDPQSVQQQEFRQIFIDFLGEALSQVPDSSSTTQSSNSGKKAIPSRRLLDSSTASASSSLVGEILRQASQLLSSQSSDLVSLSQQIINSKNLTLGIFRGDGFVESNVLSIPLVSSGNSVTLNSTFARYASTELWDYKLIVSELNQFLEAGLASGGSASVTDWLASQLFSVELTSPYNGALDSDFTGQNVQLTVPYSASSCTLVSTNASLVCAHLCLRFDLTTNIWTTDGVDTIIDSDSIVNHIAVCELQQPGIVGVNRQLVAMPTKPTSPTGPTTGGGAGGGVLSEESGKGGVFSASGMKPGGAGFFIVLFLCIFVAAAGIVAYYMLAKRPAQKEGTQVPQADPSAAKQPSQAVSRMKDMWDQAKKGTTARRKSQFTIEMPEHDAAGVATAEVPEEVPAEKSEDVRGPAQSPLHARALPSFAAGSPAFSPSPDVEVTAKGSPIGSPTGSPGESPADSPAASPTGSPHLNASPVPHGSPVPSPIALPSYAAGSPAVLEQSDNDDAGSEPSVSPNPLSSPEIRNPANSPASGLATLDRAQVGAGELSYPLSFQLSNMTNAAPVAGSPSGEVDPNANPGRIFYYLNNGGRSRGQSRTNGNGQPGDAAAAAVPLVQPAAGDQGSIPAAQVRLSPDLLAEQNRRPYAIDELTNQASVALEEAIRHQRSRARNASSQFANLESDEKNSFYDNAAATPLSPEAQPLFHPDPHSDRGQPKPNADAAKKGNK